MRMELFHYLNYQDPNSPAGNAKITDFMGNPDLSSPTTGTFQANQTANLVLTFPSVPVGTVINTRDHTMWSTDYPVHSLDACNGVGFPTYSDAKSPLLSPVSWNGIAGRISPSLTDMKNLIAGWSGQISNYWLTAETQAVAPDLSEVESAFDS